MSFARKLLGQIPQKWRAKQNAGKKTANFRFMMPHKLIVSVRELKDRREALEKRRLWRHVREAAGRYAVIHGDAGAARFFRLPSHIVRYWHQKMSDPTFHPRPWGGFEYKYIIFLPTRG